MPPIIDMNMAHILPIEQKLQQDPASVLAAARRRSPDESLVIANTWRPEQSYLSTADALDLFLSYLKEEDVPASATPTTAFCDAANIALGGFFGLTKIASAYDEPRSVKRVMDAWGGIFKWGRFIFTTRVEGLERDDTRRRTAIEILSMSWYTLCAPDPMREIMISAPMVVEMSTRMCLSEDDAPNSNLRVPAGTSFLAKLLSSARKEHLDRVLNTVGGLADVIAKVLIARVQSVVKARPVNRFALMMHLDLINLLSRIVGHPLRYALLGANAIWVVTNALTVIAIQLNADPVNLASRNAMVSAIGYLVNCLDSTDGFTWVSQSIGAGLLSAYVDCSPHFSMLDTDDRHMVLRIVSDILPRYTVYRTVLQAMDWLMRELRSGPQRDRLGQSVAQDVWIPFFVSFCDRIKVLHYSKGQQFPCDNVKCKNVAVRAHVLRCSACLTTFYCSTECVTIAWEEGQQKIAWKEANHQEICYMTQRARAGGKASRITKRDLAFIHTISMYDARKNIAKIIKRADNEYPGKVKSSLIICIDYCVFPTTFDLKPIEQYNVDPYNGLSKAVMRKKNMIGKVKDNTGKYALLEARVAHGEGIQAILTLATGDVWKHDPEQEQRQMMIDAQTAFHYFDTPASKKSPILADPILTDEELMAMQELSDEDGD